MIIDSQTELSFAAVQPEHERCWEMGIIQLMTWYYTDSNCLISFDLMIIDYCKRIFFDYNIL